MYGTFLVLSIFLAVLFITFGWLKVVKQQRMLDSAAHLGYSVRAFQAIGVTEIAAGGGLILGQFWTPIGIAAAAGLVVLLIGAALSHRRAGDEPRAVVPPLWLGVLAAVTAIAGIISA